jgi:hypothetical protein
MPQRVEASPRLDAQAREVMTNAVSVSQNQSWPVARRFGSGAPTYIRVTGHMAVAQPSGRGELHDVRQDRQSLWNYQISFGSPAAHLRGHSRTATRAAGLPEPFCCDQPKPRRCGPQAMPLGPGAP